MRIVRNNQLHFLDLIKRTIAFSVIATSKKGIWNRNPSTFEEMVLSSEEKKKMAEEGTERAKERGSGRVKNKIVDTLSSYLDVPKKLKWYDPLQ
jgi:hypothetical protein